ncbi:hypothetical protein SNE40_004775 [Patella caerulea]|uniref:Thioredoxin-like fold domain-containing protein n=1 Tax=Patella caerulea TaxID=87958 RepID=A0AAN8PYI4_PATCE
MLTFPTCSFYLRFPYNGETVADSAFIIEYLNKKLALDLSMNLTQTERAIGRAFSKMMEDNTYWYVLVHVCNYNILNGFTNSTK